AGSAKQPQDAQPQPGRKPVKPGAAGELRPKTDPGADRCRLKPLAPATASPGAQQRWQRDPDRADLGAAAVHGAGVWQIARDGKPVQHRRQDRAHGPRISPAIGMSPDLAIDYAM